MNLTAHFTLEELVASDFAIRHGLSNIPTDNEVLVNLNVLASGLERVRGIVGSPVVVSSGYRSPKVNSGVGGSKTSAHMRGLAADIVVPGLTPLEVCEMLARSHEFIGFDQLIYEGTWSHIAFPDAESEPAGTVLTAHFAPGKPTTYTKGLA